MMAVSQSLQFIAAVFLVVTSLTAVGGYAQLAETLGEDMTPPPYADCSTNFTTLERALYNTGDNRFQIISTFYPARESVTLYAHVNYIFCENTTSEDNCTEPEKWWWTTGTFYFIQSPSVLRFTSLFFVYPEGRIGELTITLPMACAAVSRTRMGHGRNLKEGMLEILTQRLKLYGQYNSLDKIVIAEYTGFFPKAIPVNRSAYDVYGKAVGGHYKLLLFFLLTLALPVVTILMYIFAYKSSRVKLRVAFTDPRWYPSLASLVAIGICFSMFVLGMDICALVWAFDRQHFNEWKTAPDVHVESIASFQFVIVTFVIDVFCVVVGLGLIVLAFIKWLARKNIDPKDQIRCMQLLYFSFVGPIGCLASHGCYMVVGWLTDPRHGGAIFLIYAFSFLLYLVFGKLLYQFIEDRGLQEGDGTHMVEVISTEYHMNISSSLVKRKFSFFSLFWVIIFEIVFVGFKAYIIAAFAELPLVGILEYMPQYLLSLFQIAVLIATIVLSYKYLTGNSPVDRQLLLGAIDNMKYLQQQQRKREEQTEAEDEEEEEEEEEEEGREDQRLQERRRRRQQGDRPQTDTEVERAAAILGAIGYKLLFDTPPPPVDDQSTLGFLQTDDHRHTRRGAVRDFFQNKICTSSDPRRRRLAPREGEGGPAPPPPR